MNWAGMRVYDSVLSDDEMASELNKICVSADTCADVLTAGCDTAPACPVPIAPVYSLPPTTKLAYPADNYNQLLTTPISIQAETNGGFSILGKFFLASSTTYPWRLYQMRNFDLAVSGALDIQFQLYQMSASANYEVQFRNMRSSDTCHFSFPRLTEENSWYSIAVKYSTVDDSFELRFNNEIVLQESCVSGNLENFELNRVLVQEQNWAGLRLYDSLLTDAEVASELDKICVPADTCADVLTAGCDTAPACPESEETDCDAVSVSYWSIKKSTCP